MYILRSRRRFLQAISLVGSRLPRLATNLDWPYTAAAPSSYQIESPFFGVVFDAATGQLSAWRKDGSPFLLNAVSRAVMALGARATTDPDYKRTVETRKVEDRLGSGQQLTARCGDRRRVLDLEVRVTLYEQRSALVVETVARNASKKDSLLLTSVEPVRAVFEEGGGCHWRQVRKVLTNGYMYYDPGSLEDFDRARRRPIESVWNMGFYRGEEEEGLVVGFLENDFADGRIAAWGDNTVQGTPLQGGFSLVASALLNRETVLKPDEWVTTGRVALHIGPDPFTALETYAQAVGDVHNVRLNGIINGWCNWFYTHEYVTEDEIVRNAEFAATHLRPYGLEYIQIDDGYQRAYGDWEGGDNFPHGMKWLSRKIRELNLKPGIWVAPYCITEGTEVHQKHPEWLVRNLDGSIKLCHEAQRTGVAPGGYGTPQFMRNIYGLDITHPEAAEWVRKLFDTVANDWGFDFIKIDFVEWTLLAAERYHDPHFSKAAAYRKGFQIIRQAIGPNRHLLDCGPMNVTVGLLDSARIELDLPFLTWEQYTGNFNSNAPAMAKRYYFHNRAWINDDDHLGLALLTLPQCEAAASLVALSGGTLISGDRLIDLDPIRLELLKKVFPSYGRTARPLDLFAREKPEIFALPVKKDFGQWLVVGIFNYNEKDSSVKQIDLRQLRLEPSRTYIAFDFWSQRLYGEVRGNLEVRLNPSSVALLAVHEKRDTPQVVSTSRHFTQGGIELERVDWDNSTKTLRGVSLGQQGTSHNVSIYIPQNYRWAEDLYAYYKDEGAFSLKLIDRRVLRVHVRFERTQRVSWEAKFVASS